MAGQRWVSEHRRDRSVPQIRLEQPLPPLPLLPGPVSPVTPRIRIQIPETAQWEPYRDDPSEDEGQNVMVDLREGGRRMQRRAHPVANGLLSPITPRSAIRSPSRLRQSRITRIGMQERGSPITPTISISQCPSLASSNSSRRSSTDTGRIISTPVEDETSKPPGYEPMYDYLRSRPPPPHIFTSPNSNTFLSPSTHPQSPVDYMPYSDEERPFIITLSPLSPREPGPPSYEELYLQYACPQRQEALADMVRAMDSQDTWAEDICKFMFGMVILGVTVVGVGLAFNWGQGWCQDGQQC